MYLYNVLFNTISMFQIEVIHDNMIIIGYWEINEPYFDIFVILVFKLISLIAYALFYLLQKEFFVYINISTHHNLDLLRS